MDGIASLQSALGLVFRNPRLLEQALVHRSYLNENPGFRLGSNERLEFLGDAVIGFITAENLYSDFPELPEGGLTRLRAVLVRRDTLARAARALRLGEYLYLGRGEERSGGRRRPRNLASTFEAVVGAIYLDQGLATARDFVLEALAGELDRAGREAEDYKSKFQEIVQAKHHLPPSYRVIDAVGPDHRRWFTVEVSVEGEVLGRGSGWSKQVAEKEAARAALQVIAEGWGE